MNNEDIHLKLLRKLEENPGYTQRELSQEMGVSLGKVNYCIKKLTEKGWLKFGNFSRNKKKSNYLYLLTPKGIEEKTILTLKFLKLKINEYEALKKEIDKLKQDAEKINS
jgi:EPS-associated MarR family transcriptional regulator